jgi:phosphoserine phosphatase
LLASFPLPAQAQNDPLASWNDRVAKERIVAFVRAVTDKTGKDFVPPAERIAVFDNDGTLWCEQPMYAQLVFAIDRVKTLAPDHPEWRDKPLFQAVLNNDRKGIEAAGVKGMLDLVTTTHAGMTTEEFAKIVTDWLAGARHPRFQRPYTDLVYQPMLELLAYLRANGFKTYIVSGGGLEFMRPWTEKVYGIPPEQVIGSTIVTRFEIRDRRPVLIRLPEIEFVDDKENKPVAIDKIIGRRPILAAGNSDGDLAMLQYTAAGPGPRFCLYVHHTDAEREWAYDRQSGIGRLNKGLDEAKSRGWTVVSMKEDWKTIFPE